jgi:flagellar basal body-associated protein FliL
MANNSWLIPVIVVAVIVLLLAIGLALFLTRKAKAAQNGGKKDAVVLQPHYGASPLVVHEYVQPPVQVVASYDSVPAVQNHYAPAPAFSAASGSAETIRTIESANTYDAPPSVVAMQ